MPHLKQQTKQKYKPNHHRTGLPPHSALRTRGKTNKNSAQISPHTKLTQTTGPTLETKRKKEFNLETWEKKTSNTVNLKKKERKERQRNATQTKEQTKNTEVQINEEEIGKLHEKEFRIMIVKMIKNLENKVEKM